MQFSTLLYENNIVPTDPKSFPKSVRPIASAIFSASPSSILIVHVPQKAYYKTPVGYFVKDFLRKTKLARTTKEELLSSLWDYKASPDVTFHKLLEETTPVTDDILIQRLKQNDETAFTMIYEKYKASLTTYARKKTKDRDAADDLVQEAFLKLHTNRVTYDPKVPLYTFLTRAIDTISIDKYRKEQAGKRPKIKYTDQDNLVDKEETAIEVVSMAEENEKKKEVWDAIMKLEMPYRAVLVFSDLESLVSDEVGTLLGVSSSTVRSQLIQARKKFEKIFKARFLG